MADTTKNPPLACYYLAAVWPTCGVARAGASSRIPSAGVGPGPRNLPSGNALYAVPTLGCVGHVSDSGDTGVGVQRDVRHHDERTMDVGDHSVDRRLAAAQGLVSSGIRSFDGGERSHEIFRGSPDSPAGRLFPCSAASFGNWMWFLLIPVGALAGDVLVRPQAAIPVAHSPHRPDALLVEGSCPCRPRGSNLKTTRMKAPHRTGR